MYSVLIVDDEKLIREDLFGLLSLQEQWELDIACAASAVEAQTIFEERKIDIVITDINMPKMSGLELYDVIREQWPYCKMIFLTGYADFDYVYKVHKHARYVLKAEEDEKLLEALQESMEELGSDLLLEQLSDSVKETNSRAILHQRRFLFAELFDGHRELSQLTPELAEKLEISLDPQQKLYYVIFRHDAIKQDDYWEQQKVVQVYYQLVYKYFLDFMHGTFFEYSRNYAVALLQPNKLCNEKTVVKMLAGSGELFLKALKKNLGMDNAVLIGEDAVFLEQLVQEFGGICSRMAWLASDELSVEKLHQEAVEKESLTEVKKQELLQMVVKLEYYLEGMEEENILSVLSKLQNELQGIKSMHDLFALEVYCGISYKLIGWIKRLGISEELAFRVGTMNLYNVSLHANWHDAFGYLRHVAEEIFQIKNQNVEKQNEDVVNQVKRYIAEHISGDTSLYALAQQVHFSQEYLLRTFKKKEGITILQYINDLKLGMAKQLLSGSELPVKEIAEQLGFASQGYFGRFFRSKTGLSPNAWRDGEKRRHRPDNLLEKDISAPYTD